MHISNFWVILKSKLISKPSLAEITLVLAYRQLNINYDTIRTELSLKPDSLQDYTRLIYTNNLSAFDQLRQYLSYEQLLEIDVAFKSFNRKLKQDIFKQLWYPSLLLVVLFMVLSLFLFRLYPSLHSLLVEMDLTTTSVSFIYGFLLVVFIGMSLFFLVFLVSLLLLLNQQNQKIFILLFKNSRLLLLGKKIYTHFFAYLFHLYLAYGASTRQILTLMKTAQFSNIVRWLAILTIYELDEGQSIDEAFNPALFDPSFIRFIHIATLANTLKEHLERYLDLNERIIKVMIKRLSTVLQSVVYVLIGLLMILLYQLLFTPMQLLNSL